MDKKRILIIDDEENFCKLVKKNIEQAGKFEVDIATNGQDGISLARQIKPDLILLDILMPEMDGAEVAAQIRDDESIRNTPIVFLTAIAKEEDSDSQASLTKGYALLSKTATLRELMACIEENVRRYTEP